MGWGLEIISHPKNVRLTKEVQYGSYQINLEVEKTCNIPAGKAILIPLLTGECGYDDPAIKNDEDLRNCGMAGNEYGVIEATVDGVKLFFKTIYVNTIIIGRSLT